MTTKEDVKRLLGKGLTGKEAGRLVLQDNWLADHDKDGFLSLKDINTIKNSLKTTQDIKDYNSYIRSYELLDYTLKQAEISKYGAEKIILLMDQHLLMTLNDLMTEHLDSMTRPTIMTEKQYQDVKADQRARLMKADHSVDRIILWRVEEKYPGYLEPLEEGGEYMVEADLEYLVEKEPDKLREAILDIIQLLKTDQIQPVTFSEKYVKRMQDIRTERQAILDATDDIELEDLTYDLDKTHVFGRVLTKEELTTLYGLDQEEQRIKSEAIKAGKGDQEKLISTLEGLMDGSVKPEQAEAILRTFHTTGEELYKAGLPEHISWIDTFKPSFFGGDGTLGGIAIIQDPKPDMVDKRGYYIDNREDALFPYDQIITGDSYAKAHKQSIDSIRLFLAFHSIVEAVSEVIGIDFAEDTRGCLARLSQTIDSHNMIVKKARYYALPEKIGYEIKALKLDRYKPSAKTFNYLRDRMAISLGDGWDEATKALTEDLEEREDIDD